VLANKDQELDSVTLTKFSPASSSQAQLLRLLKTIDYLYNPKAGEPKEQEKDDERQAREIFSSFDFAPCGSSSVTA
jgi:E3 ubiquitin-protein ligase HUWE1